LEIPNTVKTIAPYAFGGTVTLKEVTIGSGVSDLSIDAFRGCENLADIKINKANKNYSAEGGIIYNKSKTMALAAYSAVGYGLSVSSKTKTIGYQAFSGNRKAKTVKLPNSVTNITYSAFSISSFKVF
jgi:hypothetical protein